MSKTRQIESKMGMVSYYHITFIIINNVIVNVATIISVIKILIIVIITPNYFCHRYYYHGRYHYL